MKPSSAPRTPVLALALLCSACASPGRVLPEADRGAYPEPPAAAVLPDLSQLSYNAMANRYLLPLYTRLPPREVYCGCTFDTATRAVEPAACGFAPDKPWGDDATRGARIEWEHVVPAARMVQALGCSSRAACRSNEAFRLAENDPYNLLPALGALNARRSNHPYTELPGEPRVYGRCDFELEQHREQRQQLGRVEPPEDIKGDVARISLYYSQRYGLPFSDAEIQQFQAWSAQDPVSPEERYRAAYIRKQITGWANPFVE
ncbi:endonuclease [Solimonas sp. K1W22B-7]|uniref:endonuclease n=1 Tax=Solimonas sp. K1W22B-7 TaxID=2303331 RepID=UPI0013C41FA4|nr:endonuclease [Solimonas sp. K1W22B-7]